MAKPLSSAVPERLGALLGPRGFTVAAADLEPWLVDWRGRYRGAAFGMASPASTEEVCDIVRLCAEHRVAIVPQGGNSGMVGGATPDASGEALLLSLRRMNRIRSLSPEDRRAVCEAGVVLETLHEAAAAQGLRFPLTLGGKGSATVGGLCSTNAGGTQVLRFGTMRALVEGLEAVLPDGSVLDALAPLTKDNRGYDLKQLLIGGEGTLGIITAVSLRLVPAADSRAVAWAALKSTHDALALLRLAEDRLGDAVESFELMPRHGLELVVRHVEGTRAPFPPAAWNVLIEATAPPVASDPAAALQDFLEAALETGLIADAAVAASEAHAQAFWMLRDAVAEAERKAGPSAKHDVSVPVAAMPAFIEEATQAVERAFAGVRVLAFGHLGDGNVHFNVQAPADAGLGWLAEDSPAVTRFVHDLVTASGGSISAEHGIGQARLAELARLGDPAQLAAQRAIKQALDPLGIMNPGKLVPLA